jgi:hypothetical protein
VGLVKDRPFVLFGHCVGGLLAWHVACALKKRSCPPFRLVLYDAPMAQGGINVTSMSRKWAAQSRFRKAIRGYRASWNDWLTWHEDNWYSRAGFVLWAFNNFFMRQGWDRSRRGQENFAKLAYLRALQGCPLSAYASEALLIYHYAQAEIVSRSLWHAHSTSESQFEFIPGDHSDWESAIFHTIPLIRHQLEALAAREKAVAPEEGAPDAVFWPRLCRAQVL